MLTYIFQALHTFRKVFSRRATWLACCIVACGFLAATHIDGVSSFCRFWHLQIFGVVKIEPEDLGRLGVGREKLLQQHLGQTREFGAPYSCSNREMVGCDARAGPL